MKGYAPDGCYRVKRGEREGWEEEQGEGERGKEGEGERGKEGEGERGTCRV